MKKNIDQRNQPFPHVVIIGAGFGGLHAARALAGMPVRATLVDRNNYHLFQPLLYQAATAMLAENEIAYPVRAALRGSRNLVFHLGEVQEIDLDRKCVKTSNGILHYNYLVFAPGGETNYFGVDSAARNGFALKNLDDAVKIRSHLLLQFELAVHEPDREKRRAMLTFVVVGGGPTGVETAGAISELARMVLPKDYPEIDPGEVQIILLEAKGRLLLNMPEELARISEDVLRSKQVDVRLNCIVDSYDGQRVIIKNGSAIPTATLIWAAGVRAVRLLDSLGLDQDHLGRVRVEKTLQVPGRPEVFVIGDAAHLAGPDGQPLPMLAPVAIQQAKQAARNIMALVEKMPAKPFVYRDPGVLAAIGRSQAVARLGRLKLHGFAAWLIWIVVHIYQLIGFRSRLAVLVNWAWDYIFYERAVRLIFPAGFDD